MRKRPSFRVLVPSVRELLITADKSPSEVSGFCGGLSLEAWCVRRKGGEGEDS